MKRRNAGFTLIELVVAVAIAAILTRIGYVSYSKYILRGNRAVARTVLLSLTNKQETLMLRKGGYSTALSDLGLTSGSGTSVYIDQNGAPSDTSTSSSIYQISFAASPTASATAYALQAVAINVQAQRDKNCTTLIVNSNGLQQASNSGGTAQTGSNLATCWEK